MFGFITITKCKKDPTCYHQNITETQKSRCLCAEMKGVNRQITLKHRRRRDTANQSLIERRVSSWNNTVSNQSPQIITGDEGRNIKYTETEGGGIRRTGRRAREGGVMDAICQCAPKGISKPMIRGT